MNEFKPLFSGVINVSGKPNVGKTAFGLETGAHPKRIGYLTWDVKNLTMPREEFGLYRSFMDIRAPMHNVAHQMNELALGIEGIKEINGIEPGSLDVINLDAYETLYASFKALAEVRKGSLQKEYSNRPKYAQMQVNAMPNKVLQPGLLGYLLETKKIPLVIIINHLTDEYKRELGGGDSVKTGRRVPNATLSMEEKATLRLWLVPNPNHRMPNALVLKNMGKHTWVEGKGIQTPTVFPPKLDQRILSDWEEMDYISLWDVIKKYWKNPVGNRELHAFEIPTDEEARMIEGSLSDTEKQTLEYNKKLALVSQNPELTDAVHALLVEGMNPIKISAQLREEFGVVPIPTIKKIGEIINGE